VKYAEVSGLIAKGLLDTMYHTKETSQLHYAMCAILYVMGPHEFGSTRWEIWEEISNLMSSQKD